MLRIAFNLPSSFCLNYPEIPDSCFFLKFRIRIYLFNMFVDSTNIHIVHYSHHLLCQPYIFILVAHLNTVLLSTYRCNIDQIFRCAGTNSCIHFIFNQSTHHFLPSQFFSHGLAIPLFQWFVIPNHASLSLAFLDGYHMVRTSCSPRRSAPSEQGDALHMACLDMQNVFTIFPFKGTSPQPFLCSSRLWEYIQDKAHIICRCLLL